MDEWVQNPTAKTALDDIIPCVDNATAQETLRQTKETTYQLVNVVDYVVSNVSNRNFPPQAGNLYYNQSGSLMPVWKKYICQVSSSGICTTPGRLTPSLYKQMESAVNLSYGLSRYGPFLVNLEDCTFVRETFTKISHSYCPDLRRYSQWIYVGLVIVSAAVMLSLIFWVIYARERGIVCIPRSSKALARHHEIPLIILVVI
ncbi:TRANSMEMBRANE PROTEIN [Salix viminalis]|uniref:TRANSMEMBRANE PROTEIN n=1 Tax=Salix viminalis TaxID=40686 RepID=A0A9Q0NP91_SALVM|nr:TRANSMEMBRANE PROTEIN [Salix viminalis]